MMKKLLIFVIAVIFAFPSISHAQTEVIVGTGTESTFTAPFGNYYRNSWDETIYSADEIGMGGIINSLAYNCSQTSSLTFSMLKIYMGVTSNANHTTGTDWLPYEDLTLVYSGSNVVVGSSTGWQTFTLDSPYAYNGIDNLVIVVAKICDSYSSSLWWNYTSVSGSVMHRQSDSNATYASYPYNESGSILADRPNIKLSIDASGEPNFNLSTTDLGYRPNGAWMRPVEVSLRNFGAPTSVTGIEPTNEFFTVEGATYPTMVTSQTPLNIQLTTGATTPGTVNASLVVLYSSRSAAVLDITATAYEPVCPDVWEMAQNVTTFPYSNTVSGVYDNYQLPGSNADGNDAVFKMTFTEDKALNAAVFATDGVSAANNSKIALYAEDFNGEEGPKSFNYYAGPQTRGRENAGITLYTTAYEGWYSVNLDDLANPVRLAPKAAGYKLRAAKRVGNYVYGYYYGKTWLNEYYKTPVSAPGSSYDFINPQTANQTFGMAYSAELNVAYIMSQLDEKVKRINLQDGTVIEGYDIACPAFQGITFDNHGNLYGMVSNWFCFIDIQNRTYTRLFNTGLTDYPDTCMGLIYDPVNNVFYWARYNDEDAASLYKINISNQTCTYMGFIPINIFEIFDIQIEGVSGNEVFYGGDSPIQELTVPAGTYYLAASSTDASFNVNIDAATIPVPEDPLCVSPTDGTSDVVTPVSLKWMLGRYTTQYQVVMGTSYPPTEVVVDWTSDLATSYRTNTLLNNKNYFWRVNERNSSGTTYGPVWGFTTSLNVPQNMLAADYNLYLGESANLSWTGVNDRSHRGYNVYQDGVKINANVLTTTSYTVDGLAYNMDGYEFQVTAVYDEGESQKSNAAIVYVSGNGAVSGTVFEQDGVTPIEGVTVTIEGVDEYNVHQTFTYTTAANGTYSGEILAGTYDGTASKSGYQDATCGRVVRVSYNQETENINFVMTESYVPVGEVIAEEIDDNMVKVYWNWTSMSALVEDFETGDFTANAWDNTVTPSYPWAISTTTPYEGMYCMKSTGEGTNNLSSAIQITVDVPYNGLMSFYQMISSESNYDKGHFYIDGSEQTTVSGSSNWAYKEFNVSEGQHTYKWEYTKDGSVNSGSDYYAIDYVTFYQQPEPWAGEGWIFYDDGTNVDAVGLTEGGSFYWGIMFPSATLAQYGSFSLTKVGYFDYTAHTGNILIYEGGDNAPGTLIHQQAYTATGSNTYVEYNLTTALPINNSQNLWIVMNNNDGQYVASASTDTGNPNGRWISLDGATWEDVAALGLSYTWNLRGFITNQRGHVMALANDKASSKIAYEGKGTPGGVLTHDPDAKITVTNFGKTMRGNDRSFQSFSIYRTDCYNEDYSEENIELLASGLTDTVYMDMSWANTEAGVYKWGVRANYDGNRNDRQVSTYAPGDVVITGTSRHKWFTLDLADMTINEFGEDFPDNYYVRGGTKVNDKYYMYFYGSPWNNEFVTTPAANPGSSYNYINPSTPYNITQLVYNDVLDEMWAFSSQQGRMVPIDMVTGLFLNGGLDVYASQGICADDEGNYYVMFHGILHSVDLTTGEMTELVNTGFTEYQSSKMTMIYDKVNKVFYWAVYNGNDSTPVYKIDANAGTSEVIGDLGVRIYDFVDIEAAEAPYVGNGESPITWSNCLDKDMITSLDVTVSTNSGDSPAGTSVSFVNISEPDMAIAYEVELDETGVYTWDEVRKGTYVYSISLDGFTSCAANDTIEIWDATSIVCEMEEIISSVGNLYVSPTGWAMWDGQGTPVPPVGAGDEFTVDFEGGVPSGWTMIDADGDGQNWIYDDGTMGGPAHAGTGYMTSASYDNSIGILYPDNYLVSTQVTLGGSSALSFFVCGQDAAYAGEHYGVAISTGSNTNASDFTTIWEETLTAKGQAYAGPRGTRDIGNWYQKTVDLSAYAGQQVYIAIRHFNCHDMFRLNLDDVVLANAANLGRNIESFKVLIDGDFEANVENNYYQHDVTNFVEGQEYTTSVATVYSTGVSEWMDYTWIYAPCDNYEGVTDLTAEKEDANVVLNWVMPEGGVTPPTPGGGDEFTVDFEGGVPSGWTMIDADGDGNNWIYDDGTMGGTAHGGTGYMTSASYDNSIGILYPDNYLVSTQVEIGGGSSLSFYVCGQDAAYAGEHFGVAISTGSNTNASDFTTIWEETLTAKGNAYAGPRGTRAQGAWYQKTVDLSTYAGQQVYIAIRHFNCSDMFRLNLDDVVLSAGSKAGRTILFEQSEMITHPGQGANGADASAICGESAGAANFGPNANWALGNGSYYLLADDFTLDAASNISTMEFYGYQTGSGNNSTMTGLYIQIYDGNPMNGGNVVWGDNATNLLTSTGFTNIYRVSIAYTGLTDVNRPIMFLQADNLNIDLEAGTYWVQVGFTGSSSSGPWGVPRSIWDETVSGNGLQKVDTGWSLWNDAGQKGLPMVISGNSGPVPPTPVGGILGSMIFRNGELITPAPIAGNTYTDENPEPGEYEYCVRVVYGEEEYANGWYAMSCPVCASVSTACVAPTELEGTYTFNENGTYGATIEWVGNNIATLDHYNLYRSTTNGNYMLLAEVPASQTSYYDDRTDYPDEYFYKLTAYYVNGEDECESEPAHSAINPDDDYITVNVTDLEENDIDNARIYPNPTNDNLNIFVNGMTRITVSTVLGQVVYDQEVNTDNTIINMSNFGAGVYMVRINTENGSMVKHVTVIE